MGCSKSISGYTPHYHRAKQNRHWWALILLQAFLLYLKSSMPIYLILCFTFSKIALNIFINSLISCISLSLFFVALQEDAADCVVIEDFANGVRAGTVKSSMKRGWDMEPQSSRRNSLWSQCYKIGKAIN
jgi:hypothetical protein